MYFQSQLRLPKILPFVRPVSVESFIELTSSAQCRPAVSSILFTAGQRPQTRVKASKCDGRHVVCARRTLSTCTMQKPEEHLYLQLYDIGAGDGWCWWSRKDTGCRVELAARCITHDQPSFLQVTAQAKLRMRHSSCVGGGSD